MFEKEINVHIGLNLFTRLQNFVDIYTQIIN
jgi:hypothetical protein